MSTALVIVSKECVVCVQISHCVHCLLKQRSCRMSGPAMYGLHDAVYSVASMMGPCSVFTSTARRSEVKLFMILW